MKNSHTEECESLVKQELDTISKPHDNNESYSFKSVSTDEFLRTIFKGFDEDSGERVAIGHLKSIGGGIPCFPHRPSNNLVNPTRTASTLYFSIAGIKDKNVRAANIARRKETYHATYIIVCDDVGTKVDHEIMPNPSYKLETSKGNFQYGYLLNKPIDDYNTVEHLMKCISDNGFSDPGFRHPHHLARMPNSYHLKKKFAARLTTWSPERRFSLEQVREMFDVTEDTPRESKDNPAYNGTDDVLTWLKKEGHLTGKVSNDWYGVTCPKESEHSDDTGPKQTSYSPTRRAFNCLHSHVIHTTDYYAWVVKQGGPDGRTMSMDKQGDEINRIRDLTPEFNIFNLPDLKLTEKGKPRDTQITSNKNIKSIAEHAGIIIRYDMMNKDISLSHKMDSSLSNSILLSRLMELCEICNLKSRTKVQQNLLSLAQLDRFHPAEEWLLKTKWDGVDHLDELLNSVVLSDSNSQQLFAVYLRKWLIQVVEGVRGWRRETCQPKGYVLTFAGKGGCGKSTWIKSLVPPLFFQGEQPLHLNSMNWKDAVMKATRKPLCELSELDQSLRASDWAALKSFLTSPEDIYRAPYAAREEAHPRMTSFYASVNNVGFISDKQGARRFWPVNVNNCNAYHGVNLGQLWAQINMCWEAGEVSYLSQEQELIREQELEYFMVTSQLKEALEAEYNLEATREILYKKRQSEEKKGGNRPPMTALVEQHGAHVVTASQLLKGLHHQYGPFERGNVPLLQELLTLLTTYVGPRMKIFARKNSWALIKNQK